MYGEQLDFFLTSHAVASSGGGLALLLVRGWNSSILNSSILNNTASPNASAAVWAARVAQRVAAGSHRRVMLQATVLEQPSALLAGILDYSKSESQHCGLGSGGGMCITSLADVFTITNCTFLRNVAARAGGGAFVRTDQCKKVNSAAAVFGAAQGQTSTYASECVFNITRSAFTANLASCAGSGLYLSEGRGVQVQCSDGVNIVSSAASVSCFSGNTMPERTSSACSANASIWLHKEEAPAVAGGGNTGDGVDGAIASWPARLQLDSPTTGQVPINLPALPAGIAAAVASDEPFQLVFIMHDTRGAPTALDLGSSVQVSAVDVAQEDLLDSCILSK